FQADRRRTQDDDRPAAGTPPTRPPSLNASLAPPRPPAAVDANHQGHARGVRWEAPRNGGFLVHAISPQEGSEARFCRFHPPSPGKTIQVHTQLNMDGRTFAKLVTQHQYYDMNRDLSSGSGFDGRLSFSSPGVP